MPVSLLALPCELREQILTSILYQRAGIRLRQNIVRQADHTPPISQVCRQLRDETIRVFCRVNAFTLVVDPEEVSLGLMLLSRAPSIACADVDCNRQNLRIPSFAFSPTLMAATTGKLTLVYQPSHHHGIYRVSWKISAASGSI